MVSRTPRSAFRHSRKRSLFSRRGSPLLTPIPEDESCREWQPEEKSKSIPNSKRRSSSSSSSSQKKRSETDSYALIDYQRRHAHLPRLRLSSQLEKLACQHAWAMALQQTVSHSVDSLADLQAKLDSAVVGENVQRGPSCLAMHLLAMTQSSNQVNRQNILGADFTEYGIATVRGEDNQLYMCQYFR